MINVKKKTNRANREWLLETGKSESRKPVTAGPGQPSSCWGSAPAQASPWEASNTQCLGG